MGTASCSDPQVFVQRLVGLHEHPWKRARNVGVERLRPAETLKSAAEEAVGFAFEGVFEEGLVESAGGVKRLSWTLAAGQ